MKALPLSALPLLILSLALTSCGHVREKSQAYVPATLDASEINGARVVSRLDPQGGGSGLSLSAMIYFAASYKTEGPYQVVVAARGTEGRHQWLEIKRVAFRTTTGKSETMPAKYHSEAIFFEETSMEGVTQAVYRAPVEFEPDWEKDGNVTLEIDVVVADRARRVPARIRQTFEPQELKETEFINVAKELGSALLGNGSVGDDLIE